MVTDSTAGHPDHDAVPGKTSIAVINANAAKREALVARFAPDSRASTSSVPRRIRPWPRDTAGSRRPPERGARQEFAQKPKRWRGGAEKKP